MRSHEILLALACAMLGAYLLIYAELAAYLYAIFGVSAQWYSLIMSVVCVLLVGKLRRRGAPVPHSATRDDGALNATTRTLSDMPEKQTVQESPESNRAQRRSPPPPSFPKLSIRNYLVETGAPGAAFPESAIINSRAPIPFGNDFFEGHMLILLRTQPIDPFYAEFFEGRRRLFEIQVQVSNNVPPIAFAVSSAARRS
jgi:hypothetical protein